MASQIREMRSHRREGSFGSVGSLRSGSLRNWKLVRSDSVFGSRSQHAEDDELALKWAAIERLPTYDRLNTAILREKIDGCQVAHQIINVQDVGFAESQNFINKLIQMTDEDNEKFLQQLRNRINRVGIQLPTIEVRFENLTVEAKSHVGKRSLPTVWNASRNTVEGFLDILGLIPHKKTRISILKTVSGIIKPGRMTLLLGPPGSGKTTLLLALAGKLHRDLQVTGTISYNGHFLSEFVPQKTSAYISQHDLHIGDLTVRETLEFSAQCQGVGARYEMLTELARREKQVGIFPEADVDFFMKATSTKGVHSRIVTDYTMKILGLDNCSETLVGDNMRRGISGGQKKRVTTGEMLVGPTKTLFMDEISTGLDSSTTYQIVKCLQQFVHLLEGTICMSLLQPAPETFDLFDDIILLAEGQIVYQGPRQNVIEFFKNCGFKCPDRKGAADFLQEVTSRKDQEQYWFNKSIPYRYISVQEFSEMFKQNEGGRKLAENLSHPYEKENNHKAALEFSRYTIGKMDLFRVCFAREWLLMKRNSFIFIFRGVQITIVAFIGTTVFLRTRMHQKTEQDGFYYLFALFFSLITIMFNGLAEVSMTIYRLPVFYKQRDLLFYPAWAFALPKIVSSIPMSLLEAGLWTAITYYGVGFSPEAERFFRHFFVLFLVHQMSSSLFCLIAALCRNMVIANTGGAFSLLIIFTLGGFIIRKEKIPRWWIWGYWASPLMYAENAISVNEFLADRWNKQTSNGSNLVGLRVLVDYNLFTKEHWYWIGVGALLGFVILFNLLFTWALTYLDPIERPQNFVAEESEAFSPEKTTSNEQVVDSGRPRTRLQPWRRTSLSARDSNRAGDLQLQNVRNQSFGADFPESDLDIQIPHKHGMILPFQPLAISFENINYYVDMPVEMRDQGVTETRLQLLHNITGAFRPNVLTALMGVSGAGKTTLMDVLAGRKTTGYFEGDIWISGFPKKQETFARISGYCEQTDIHSPQVTVYESLIFSAWLRLSRNIDQKTRMLFIQEVMELVELENLKEALVGVPGVTGLSTEQRKRLTIAVELVANPSIIFMDEPTSGLDARAAAIVMRTVRNTVNTGRTVVCTIHQPSIHIFEAFDELLLLKRGGQVIYAGALGRHSHNLITYFEAIAGVPKIKDGYNPATWMLEVTSPGVEQSLGIDFAEIYKSTSLFQRNAALAKQLSHPAPTAKDLFFPTKFSQPSFVQFISCLWKQNLTYWRSPEYNCARLLFTIISALLFGSIFWQFGQLKPNAKQADLLNVMGSMYGAVLFLGVINCATVQPVVDTERSVFYRERAAGMYSALPYALAQVLIEIPYILFQTITYGLITYSMMNFEWTVAKFGWYLFIMFISFLYYTYYGMMAVSISPNYQIAAIMASAFYALFNLFSGFLIPWPKIPKWWIWYYWICPVAWTVYGLITSQYGDLTTPLQLSDGSVKPIKQFLEDYFGYHHDFLGVVAAVLVGFSLFFAFMFAVCIKVLNFQQR
ncbi:hypothetical protein O6H91_12G029400 [Diphasiastrum complanatum]|uniref:Uncharacterized protein n=7 Tax=Diphasiastrum complanatum TaxID=34168 RepID=A0ACC2BZX1_DIPCM|nr:hypothetical protein O6H91_12G029400 [Diphasiastrum complanatum]KAJ7535347.1 hypothetical protein O6H91_12G029400 [Diphasiastrum complanatum]KAJ7535348.1 hypothetical protein O6H91_12G029400 [Diphasiastrum complanatum]KAJ7535349.1 hypothetical protein O6H91_12G029400 [Diphasiastrum complanatum]KAJ7535350.1 hypothetical protein O6H91_12G029400 [Diphasiastrum complanatum]